MQTIKCVVVGDGAVGKVRSLSEDIVREIIDSNNHLIPYRHVY